MMWQGGKGSLARAVPREGQMELVQGSALRLPEGPLMPLGNV